MNERDYEHKMGINQIIRTVMANKKPSEIEGILYYQDQIIEIVKLVRADERDAILKLADSLGWVDVDYIKARGDK
jgi:hypothetical protein